MALFKLDSYKRDLGHNLHVVALGSSQPNGSKWIERGTELISEHPQIMLLSQSASYPSAPFGGEVFRCFTNAAILISTQLSTLQLFYALQAIEGLCGRRRVLRNGHRTLDIDMIDSTQNISLSRLTIPHPRAHERHFVMWPAREALEVYQKATLKSKG